MSPTPVSTLSLINRLLATPSYFFYDTNVTPLSRCFGHSSQTIQVRGYLALCHMLILHGDELTFHPTPLLPPQRWTPAGNRRLLIQHIRKVK